MDYEDVKQEEKETKLRAYLCIVPQKSHSINCFYFIIQRKNNGIVNK